MGALPRLEVRPTAQPEKDVSAQGPGRKRCREEREEGTKTSLLSAPGASGARHSEGCKRHPPAGREAVTQTAALAS